MWTIGQVSRQRELLVQRPHGRLRCEDERSSNEARRLEWSGLKEMVGEEVGGKMGPPSQGLDVLSHFNLGLPDNSMVKNLPAKKKKRICLPMQGTRVPSLVWEDPTCHRACALKSPRAMTAEIHLLRTCAPQQKEATAMRSPCITTKSSPCSPPLEKALAQQQRPSATKIKFKKRKKTLNPRHVHNTSFSLKSLILVFVRCPVLLISQGSLLSSCLREPRQPRTRRWAAFLSRGSLPVFTGHP